MKLGELKKSEGGQIVSVQDSSQRFLEMGFLEGAFVKVIHEAPFGGDPFVVHVRGSLLALRRDEANQIEVSLCESH